MAKRRKRKTWFESLSPEEQERFLSDQCRAVNCPCGGDVRNHERALLEDALNWAIKRIAYAREQRQWALEELEIANRRVREMDERLEAAKLAVEFASFELQKLIDSQEPAKVIPFYPPEAPLADAAGG